MKQLLIKIAKWFLPVLFISYMAGITLFTHSHVINGVTIVHSHPFKKGVEHTHSTTEFQLIHILSQVIAEDCGLPPFTLSLFLVLICAIVCPPSRKGHSWLHLRILSLRAPPVNSIF